MTHVMRWLGAARRGHDTALAHVVERQAFGSTLGELGMIQNMVADNEIDIAATRALLVRACWELDQGSAAGDATSIAKTFAAEAIFRIVDRSVQMCGALGVTEELPPARLSWKCVRSGIRRPSEVHRWAIAKRRVGAVRRALKAPQQ